MKIEEYLKIAKTGDIIDTSCPWGHLRLVVYVGLDFITCIWVEKVDGGYRARECWAQKVTGSCVWECKIIENIYNNNKTMKITNLVKKILDKDTQILVKAGFINGDLQLTEEGTQELLGLLFLENKTKLVEIANEKINEANR
jgi:hypothetical protein